MTVNVVGRPLLGRTVVVTRARAQASGLVAQLRELGAEVVEAPAIQITDPSDDGVALRSAVARIGSFDWVVFTSPNGVHRTFAHLPQTQALGSARVAAIGPGTADALARFRVVPDLVPERFVAEGLLDVFPSPPDGGGRVLLARAEVARDVLPDGLRTMGWDVEVAAAYRTVAADFDDDVRARIAGAAAITFTSSSTVTNLLGAVEASALPPTVVSIGPITSATARERGLTVTAEAAEHTIDGLIAALLATMGAPPTPDG